MHLTKRPLGVCVSIREADQSSFLPIFGKLFKRLTFAAAVFTFPTVRLKSAFGNRLGTGATIQSFFYDDEVLLPQLGIW